MASWGIGWRIHLKKWADYFAAIDDLDKKVVSDYLAKISAASKNVENRISVIKEEISQLVDEASKGVSDIDAFYLNASKMLLLNVDDESAAILKDYLRTIDEYKILISTSGADISKLVSEYNNVWINTICANSVLSHIASLKREIAAKRRVWLDENIADMPIKVNGMTASDCIQWQNRCAEYPNYLTDEDIVKLHSAQELVSARLKSLKIQGVVEMFNELSDSEKAECLRLLRI